MARTKVYGTAQKHLDADIDWVTDTIKVSLHTSVYAPNQSTDEYFTAITGELATTNGYNAGGATLTTKTVTVTDLVTAYNADATTWTVTGGQILTARYAIIRKDTGVASTSPVLVYVDFDGDLIAATTFGLIWATTDGIFKITAT